MTWPSRLHEAIFGEPTDWSTWGWQGRGKPLTPYPGTKTCSHCGNCCRRSPCAFGQWNFTLNRCEMLVEQPDGTATCSRYQEILDMAPEKWVPSPAFGCGCSSVGLRPLDKRPGV